VQAERIPKIGALGGNVRDPLALQYIIYYFYFPFANIIQIFDYIEGSG